MTTLLIFIIVIAAVLGVLLAVFGGEIRAVKDRDPAARSRLEVLLLYPGVHAIIGHRIAHTLWQACVPFVPRALSQLMRFLTGIEIHPGAQIGPGLFIDHGMGVVIGETTIIGRNVALFQGVTLGGTGKESGKRHPTLHDDIVVGAGAKILGNITVESNAYIGANAVVIRDVPANTTVVGVPGHVTKQDGKKIDLMMDHVHVSDPMMQHMKDLLKRIKHLEDELKRIKGVKD